MNKALFLDRDGVINKDTAYLHKVENVEFVDGIFDLCKIATEKGFLIIVVTNQGGIAMGNYSEKEMRNVHNYIREEFAKKEIEISKFYFCPHHPNAAIDKFKADCGCRKPNPGMLLRAQRDFNIDFSRSVMVGDKKSDRILIDGLKSYIVKSEYCFENYDVENLREIIEKL
ncbi:MAG: HAD family hydrolase [Chitinispirillales bacterium]|jgi:D-glycero-D-manno-heptose 1,7-bisphosphate phosphatase|nr:HAD family hydrolase [Chitinispirillales bacterium]